MPVARVGGVGGGGGGLTLGPPTNTFTAATQAAAETARDTYETANAAWLAQYDDEPTYTIAISWPATPTNTVYQARRASAWADITPIIRGPIGNRGLAGGDGMAVALAFLESATAPTAPTVSQDTSNALTFTDSWSLDYPATATSPVYGVVVTYPYDGTAHTIAAGNVEGPFKVTGVDGPSGAPGGGAIEYLGGWTTTITTATDDLFQAMGFTWPTDAEFIVYYVAGDTAGEEPRLFWMLGDPIYGAVNGVTASAAGTASAAATRRQIREQITPAVYVGRDASNGALIEFSSTVTTPNARFYRYIPSVQQGSGGGSNDGVTDSAVFSLTGQDLTLTIGRTQNLPDLTTTQTLPAGSGGGATDLGIDNRDADSLEVTSSTGADATIEAATATLAGLASAADKVKLDALERSLDLGGAPTQDMQTFTYAAPPGFTPGGFAASGQFVYLAFGTVDNPDESNVIISIGTDFFNLTELGGRRVQLHELIDDSQYIALGRGVVLTLIGQSAEVVDITEASLPTPDADAFGRVYLDRSTPAAFMVHETKIARVGPMGTLSDFQDALYLGVGLQNSDYPLSGLGDVLKYYWQSSQHRFRRWVQIRPDLNDPTTWHYIFITIHNVQAELGGVGSDWLGYSDNAADFLSKVPLPFDASISYFGIITNVHGQNPVIRFRELDNTTFVPPIDPSDVHEWVTLGLYGTGAGGQTAAQVQAAIATAIATLRDSVPADRDTLNELNDAIIVLEAATGGGFTLHSGAAAPLDTLGSDGDWYLNTTDADIPMTRFLSQSPAGMNATGSSDADNYAIRVAAMQKRLLDPVLRKLDIMVARHAGLSEPPEYEWVPLTDLSEKDRAETAKLQGETLNLAYTDGVIDEDEYRERLSQNEFWGELGSWAGPNQMQELEFEREDQKAEEQADRMKAMASSNGNGGPPKNGNGGRPSD